LSGSFGRLGSLLWPDSLQSVGSLHLVGSFTTCGSLR
jgi:hypothetical protein